MKKFAQFSFLSLLLALAAFAQQEPKRLTITNADGKQTVFSLEQLNAKPHGIAVLTNPETKKQEHYRGVSLRALLTEAGVPSGDRLRGQTMRSYVEVTGTDGYSVVLALVEVDPMFQDNNILVADELDGHPLGEKLGPLRLIVPEDKRPARCVRMVESIVVRTAQ